MTVSDIHDLTADDVPSVFFPDTDIVRCILDKKIECGKRDMPVPLFVAAPMVRYSKLPFRRLVGMYGADVIYTPMIYASNFCASELCRKSEFSTDSVDSPIVQFAAKDPKIFADAAELVYPYSSGVDINCGCPKHDVTGAGLGSHLLNNPELIADMVRQARGRISDPDYSISVKIRIQYPLNKTVDLCQKLEKAGVTRLAVHGRTRYMRSEPVDREAIALVKSSVSVPVFANGGVTSFDGALDMAKETKVDGVMVANGLLTNPALFGGHNVTPLQCISDFVQLEAAKSLNFDIFHQHLNFMLRPILCAPQRRFFNELSSVAAVKDFLSNETMNLKH
ncbi:hypothetical protein QR680_001947 [Steinernema hermaphroditum]|uniref:tRNA-dihydrouridine synthase n=1 Tax=Steinernema hermaphroditum TaxID=289476 RepID=A0AA39H0L5_9BILA|nr:hypothetical protein QR680_001947 [Steinernema hermaphroditum]